MRRIKGVIVSDTMQKTVVVRADRLKPHPTYAKRYRVSRKFKAHDPERTYRAGDIVVIEETRPLSREKRWRVVELVRRNPAEREEIADPQGEELSNS